MKIVDFENLKGGRKDVKFTGGHSIRGLVAADKMGFSVNKTFIPMGEPHHWHYQHHLEACYCISGTGILTNLANNEQIFIRPDIMYVLDKNDDHTFEALTDVILISIFNPPLKGNETHDENGNYSL